MEYFIPLGITVIANKILLTIVTIDAYYIWSFPIKKIVNCEVPTVTPDVKLTVHVFLYELLHDSKYVGM